MIWAKLIRSIELFFKKFICIEFHDRAARSTDTNVLTRNFFCDSWSPPWPCVPCKRLRVTLRTGKRPPGMMFVQTVKKGTHSSPKCWFWISDRDPKTLTRQERANVGAHFYSAFLRPPWQIFQRAFERAFFGVEIAQIRIPAPPAEVLG